ncbi:MAG: ArsR family transcriptional regulator [Methanomicrobiales archaeon]|nr:ArsR family transcriptional regulator [Methanomicrobiales archaeon]
MLNGVEKSRLLDILGNRNRRRILELLRQKPCFVTEICEQLTLSPKAVIEHLHLMEQERIISCRSDARRRKYYYLLTDIEVVVNLQSRSDGGAQPEESALELEFMRSLATLRRMSAAREEMISMLDRLEREIELKINDIIRSSNDVLVNERELDLIFALAQYDLTEDELLACTGISPPELQEALERLIHRGIVERRGTHYRVRGIHAR